MFETRDLMGMPITVTVLDGAVGPGDIKEVFDYFTYIDNTFSTYKTDSEISRINKKEIIEEQYSVDMKTVLRLSEETKKITNGYFDIQRVDGSYDPSGLVKGWAIYGAACILKNKKFENFYIEAGGDIEASGRNNQNENWRVGIRNPFNAKEVVKTIYLNNMGMATSGTYIRGQHIYNPHDRKNNLLDVVSITVIGSNVYEADRFATAAFAMGRKGISFIETYPGLEGYMIGRDGIATMTSGFNNYVI
ncbi:MAG: FAD:protein FMN transferase [Candidatus Magasanikbacteria bacterium]|nr:FAD:protein FMN transferase [Candidatus Magasanikbacteria bacterium]